RASRGARGGDLHRRREPGGRQARPARPRAPLRPGVGGARGAPPRASGRPQGAVSGHGRATRRRRAADGHRRRRAPRPGRGGGRAVAGPRGAPPPGRARGGGVLSRLICIGLSHRTAPVEQREKAALSEPEARALLRDLGAAPVVREVVALSTCNRTELYAAADDLAAAEEALVGALVAHSRIDPPQLECARYAHRDERTAAHLFRVTARLDS